MDNLLEETTVFKSSFQFVTFLFCYLFDLKKMLSVHKYLGLCLLSNKTILLIFQQIRISLPSFGDGSLKL